MPDTDNKNERTGSQEAILEKLERFERMVSGNGFSRELKESLLERFKELEQAITDDSHCENEQRVSDSFERSEKRNWKQEEQKAQPAQSPGHGASVQEPADNRESMRWYFFWVGTFLCLLYIITSFVLSFVIYNTTKSPFSFLISVSSGIMVWFLRLFADYLLPMDEKRFELKKMKLQIKMLSKLFKKSKIVR